MLVSGSVDIRVSQSITCTGVFIMETDERSYLLSLKQAHENRLKALEIQAAQYGMNCPPHISTEIDHIKIQVSAIENKLKGQIEQLTSIAEKDNTQKTILVVDDEQFITLVMQKYLTKWGYKVLVANDGIEGLHIATLEKPDLIISDMVMPGLDGYELLVKVRERMIPTRYIIFTGHDQPHGLINACLRLGACDYIRKPIDDEELLSAVKMSLEVDYTLDELLREPTKAIGNLLSRLTQFIIKNKELKSEYEGFFYRLNPLLKRVVEAAERISSAYDIDIEPVFYEPLITLYKLQEDYRSELSVIERFVAQKNKKSSDYFAGRLDRLRKLIERIENPRRLSRPRKHSKK